jgi:glycosyltransferase involved in cell wall biosynthesis
MKILFALHDFLPEHVGGTEIHTHELAQELQRRGHEVAVLCTEFAMSGPKGAVVEREHAGVRVLEACHPRDYADAEESWEEPGSAKVFEDVVARERPDVVHCEHFAQWGTGVLRVARKLGVPAVATLHDYHLLCCNATLLRPDGTICDGDCSACFDGMRPPRAGAAARDASADARRAQHRADLALAELLVAPSKFLEDLFVRRGFARREQMVRLDSGVVGPWRDPQPSDPRRPLRVGYVGGLYPSKGVHLLVEAFARLEPGIAELQVHGVLEWFPAYIDRLRALAGDRSDIRFCGRFPPDRVDAILDGLDVIVTPSVWYENRPLTMQAAYRRGVAVVASDLGGMAELAEHGRSARLFPPGDVGALAEALRGLARDRGALLALAQARPRMLTMPEVATAHEAIYRRAIGQAQARATN